MSNGSIHHGGSSGGGTILLPPWLGIHQTNCHIWGMSSRIRCRDRTPLKVRPRRTIPTGERVHSPSFSPPQQHPSSPAPPSLRLSGFSLSIFLPLSSPPFHSSPGGGFIVFRRGSAPKGATLLPFSCSLQSGEVGGETLVLLMGGR